jgi:hypothetical protein
MKSGDITIVAINRVSYNIMLTADGTMMERELSGVVVCAKDGEREGAVEVGLIEEGLLVGRLVGIDGGAGEGPKMGSSVGEQVGSPVGRYDGLLDGVGRKVGNRIGYLLVGAIVGKEGTLEGKINEGIIGWG